MRQFSSLYIPAALFLGACVLLYLYDAPVVYLAEVAESHGKGSAFAFVGMLFVATVFAPITVMPAIPLLAPVFGPFLTGLLSVIGWTLGAVAAFFISRHLGRPVVGLFASLSKLDALVARIPKQTRFFVLVLMRMAIPVDLLSYALGLTRSITFPMYFFSTLIGVSWFSFAFAYLGDAFFRSNWFVLGSVGAASAVLFVVCWYILLRHIK